MTNFLCSYPRSGNHLVRFFIELLSELPTSGCINNPRDIPIYRNEFPKKIPFNITQSNKYIYYKYHEFPTNITDNDTVLFIIRDPREVIPNFCNYIYDPIQIDKYIKLIEKYIDFSGEKNILFYEDIISDKKTFILQLYDFIPIKQFEKLDYVIEHVDELFELSKKGKKRCWNNVKSNGKLRYHYNRLSPIVKNQFDSYLHDKLNNSKFDFIKNKYSL